MVTMQWNNDALRAFRLKLATLYPSERDARALLEDAGLRTAYIDLSGSPVSRWYEALAEANKHPGTLNRILALAHEQYANDPLLDGMVRGILIDIAQPTILAWRGGAPSPEKIIGSESTLVPISFLERGLERARSVARIRMLNGFGTGFLIREDVLVTNNHVIGTLAEARSAFGL
jgi:S1-C subfamily serine protease